MRLIARARSLSSISVVMALSPRSLNLSLATSVSSAGISSPPSADHGDEGLARRGGRFPGRRVIVEAAILADRLHEVGVGEGRGFRGRQDAPRQIQADDGILLVAAVHVNLPRCTTVASQVSAAVANAVESARSRRVCRVTVCRTQLLDMAPSHPRMLPSVADAQAKTPVGSGMVPVRIFCTALLDRVSTE